jgi:hypothetical protein
VVLTGASAAVEVAGIGASVEVTGTSTPVEVGGGTGASVEVTGTSTPVEVGGTGASVTVAATVEITTFVVEEAGSSRLANAALGTTARFMNESPDAATGFSAGLNATKEPINEKITDTIYLNLVKKICGRVSL